ncbi:SDR family NAD(P)-dependent oxidoreductase [Roseovarius rhodophyticola]|uniref:Glucose 1-dehydrogenase n=1 Tax=Roseovarius rhodophyticola TaxID=3080827 RepID=A0ABZ2TI18_9RHOB|nr:glucose 1-dehydrogenase [Roseovarius sp. W115]MDV2929608.1 glucose 1-dehydrogenase [Roseovarius sp. W115]
MERLLGRTAFITGAGSGFGAGIAKAFCQEGASVVVADLDAAAAHKMADALCADGGTAFGVGVDITNRDSLDAGIAFCRENLGSLNTLVANAGIGQRPVSISDTTANELTRQFETNSIGVVQSCQAALAALRDAQDPSIVITVSGIALVPRPQLYGYGMAKAAAAYFMKSLALELAPERIRVNGLFPAVGQTPMLAEFAGGKLDEGDAATFADALPLGRLITPEDVGHAAVYLASPKEAATVTGCALPVDSGRCI